MDERKRLGIKIHDLIKKTEEELKANEDEMWRFRNCALKTILLDTNDFSEALIIIKKEHHRYRIMRK